MPAKSRVGTPARPSPAKAASGKAARSRSASPSQQDLLAGVRSQALAAWQERSHETPSLPIASRAEALSRELCRELAPRSLAALAEAWAAETEECALTPFVMLGLPLELADHLRAAGADHLARQAQEFLLLAAQVRADRGEERWGTLLDSQVEAARSAHRLVVHEFVDPLWIAAGGAPPLAAMSLLEALHEARGATLPLFEARGQCVEIAAPRGLPVVRAERTRLRRLLIDLLTKASDFAPDSERIEVAVARKGAERLVVAIRGSQTGLRASLKKGGCPTAKALLATIGGSLTVEGVRGEGVTLLITLGVAGRV